MEFLKQIEDANSGQGSFFCGVWQWLCAGVFAFVARIGRLKTLHNAILPVAHRPLPSEIAARFGIALHPIGCNMVSL